MVWHNFQHFFIFNKHQCDISSKYTNWENPLKYENEKKPKYNDCVLNKKHGPWLHLYFRLTEEWVKNARYFTST